VDQLRAGVDAVIVGGYTLAQSNPCLTVKSPQLRAERLARGLPENPAKVGVASVEQVMPGSCFITLGPARRLVYTSARSTPEQVAELERAGVEVFCMGEEQVDLAAMLASLYGQGMRRVLVEGGGTLIAALLEHGLVDEMLVYIAPRIFGGRLSPTLADGAGFTAAQAPRLQLISVEVFDDEGGILVQYRLKKKE
jgi:2,5-diamino-6-(ribosylamino)-4(3H)-pyrimidinone 5'-phosphate reductase